MVQVKGVNAPKLELFKADFGQLWIVCWKVELSAVFILLP